MEQIEIKSKRGKLALYAVLIAIALIVNNYYFFFSAASVNIKPFWKFFLTACSIWVAYSLFQMVRAAIKNEPVIILHALGLEINEINKKSSFTWAQVINWEILEEENTMYLLIETFEEKKKANISWLEKKPSEIEELFKQFKPKKIEK